MTWVRLMEIVLLTEPQVPTSRGTGPSVCSGKAGGARGKVSGHNKRHSGEPDRSSCCEIQLRLPWEHGSCAQVFPSLEGQALDSQEHPACCTGRAGMVLALSALAEDPTCEARALPGQPRLPTQLPAASRGLPPWRV